MIDCIWSLLTEKYRRSVSLYQLINLSSRISYGSFNSFCMFSSFNLTFQFNSVQRLFLIQFNIAAHGNILKEGQRVGQLCIEPNGVIVIFIGRKLYLNLQIVSKLFTGKLICQLRFMNYQCRQKIVLSLNFVFLAQCRSAITCINNNYFSIALNIFY